MKIVKGESIMLTWKIQFRKELLKNISIFIWLAMLGFASLRTGSAQTAPVKLNEASSNFTPYVWAIEYGVSDLQRAGEFYTKALGFEVEESNCCAPAKILRNGAVRLLLRRSEAKPSTPDAAYTHLNMRAGDLTVAVAAVRENGGTVENDSPQEFALGKTVTVYDPFGNSINLLDIANDNKTADSKPAVFNIGVVGENLEREEAFFTTLGFQIYSREYLPDLPLQRHGAVALVLHGGAKTPAKSGRRNGTIILGTADLSMALLALKSRGVEIASSSTNRFIAFTDPSGNPLKLMQLEASTLNATNGSTKNSVASEIAKNGFEQFKKLDGRWIGRSTKGWEETITFKTIAKGSVVVENSFDAHPNETMMTMFHLDGARLLLTHYCVAGSQPRLAATAFDDGSRTITFTFLDATNLASRDKGHMDKAVFRFKDENNFSSQWTWYQDGKESWMEEIKYERQL
jgi:predicted enzyme related to lactoylglutathione lyase